ncbi:uncharacterized protein LOC130934234 [Arachis stenosperma]|uniref:uncharacterized protein LOC130934234 n=1 Tax=Arachis stenosperma TaxID=217475 RepID=UPI0025AD8321|nr:uncharacterized protein LOC130934234 [Arachis stenosperma]
MPLSVFINVFLLFHFSVSAIFQTSSFLARAVFLCSKISALSNLHFLDKDMARKNAQEAYQRVQEAKAKSRARSGGAKAVISPPPPPPPPRNVGTPSQPIVISSSNMARKNAQEAYQRVQEAKAKSRARSGGAKAVISPPPPPPPPRNVGTPSQPIVISSSNMARKNAQEAYQRVQEAKAKSRARSGGAKAVISPPPPPPPPRNVGTPSQPIVISSSSLSRPPPSAQILSEPEKKKRKTSESGSSLDGRVVIDGAIVDPPVPEVVSESDLKTRGQRIIESPPHSRDAPSSSAVHPTSSSAPSPGPGGAPPESGGGDSSTPLKK